MKIQLNEASYRSENMEATIINFEIIGQRKEGSTEIPMWQKSIAILDIEMATVKDKRHLNFMKTQNAMNCFEKFYDDTFNK